MRRFWKKLFASTPRQSATVKPHLELLEDRVVLSTMVDVVRTDGTYVQSTLRIRGDDGMNNVTIQQDDANHQIKVSYDGATQTIDTRKFPIVKYDIDLGGGNDTLNFQLTSPALTKGKTFAVNLGNGSDTANFDLGGKSDAVSANVHRTIQANLNFDIQGGTDAGADTVYLQLGGIQDTPTSAGLPDLKNTVNITANLGAGNDEFFSAIWGNLSGSSNVSYDVQGGAGEDLLAVIHRYNNATGKFEVQIDPNAALRVHLDGGADADRVRVNCIERLFGLLDVNLEGGEGDDSGIARTGDQLGVSATIKLLPFYGSGGFLNLRLFGDLDPTLHNGNRGADGRDRVESAVTSYFCQDLGVGSRWFSGIYSRTVDAGPGSANQVFNNDMLYLPYYYYYGLPV